MIGSTFIYVYPGRSAENASCSSFDEDDELRVVNRVLISLFSALMMIMTEYACLHTYRVSSITFHLLDLGAEGLMNEISTLPSLCPCWRLLLCLRLVIIVHRARSCYPRHLVLQRLRIFISEHHHHLTLNLILVLVLTPNHDRIHNLNHHLHLRERSNNENDNTGIIPAIVMATIVAMAALLKPTATAMATITTTATGPLRNRGGGHENKNSTSRASPNKN